MTRAAGRGERRVALIEKRGRFPVATPLFEPGPRVSLDKGPRWVRPGRIALVEFGRGRAQAVRDLGSPQRARDVVGALLADRGFAEGFPKTLSEEAESAASKANGHSRRDLTGLATFTVDPASARDFDDAVSAEREGDGLRLWIHIADVAAHVRPGSGLDTEARARANSTYVPGEVEPMLPAALSDNACSLNPDVERLAVTAEIVLSGDGEVSSASFYRSRVRSDARLDYEQLDRIFAGRDRPPAQVAAPLELTRAAAAALAERRSHSALEIESSEPEFSFEDGDVVGARAVAQTEAHGLIEQLMILANEQVAQLLERRRVPTLFRVHEQPDPQRILALVEQLASLDVPTPAIGKRLSPREAGALAAEASRLAAAEARRRGHGREAYTSLVLRTQQQAFYSERNLGHAGLGSPAYTHFTSPIRRYADLVVHRGVLSAVSDDVEPPRPEEVREAAPHVSGRERDAMKVERAADDICAAFLLRRELFDAGPDRQFEGEIVGIISAGAFVRFGGSLADVYEGFLAARRLQGERFELNETQTALVGSKTGRRVRLGDPVSVRVDSVEAVRGRVDLDPA